MRTAASLRETQAIRNSIRGIQKAIKGAQVEVWSFIPFMNKRIAALDCRAKLHEKIHPSNEIAMIFNYSPPYVFDFQAKKKFADASVDSEAVWYAPAFRDGTPRLPQLIPKSNPITIQEGGQSGPRLG